MLYKYKFQSATINNSGEIISRGASTTTSIQPQIIPDFTGSFFYGKDDIQINFIYNAFSVAPSMTKKKQLIISLRY